MPKLSIIGSYKVNGKVIVIPVVGEGNANLTFGKVKCYLSANLSNT